jgi:hypothetical protein
MGGGGETGRRGLGMGSVSNIGKDGNKDLRHMNRGIRFLTGAETAGAGSKQDGDLAGRGKDAGKGLAARDETGRVELRGRGNRIDGLSEGGVMSMSSSGGTGVGTEGSKQESGKATGVSEGRQAGSEISIRMGESATSEARRV